MWGEEKKSPRTLPMSGTLFFQGVARIAVHPVCKLKVVRYSEQSSTHHYNPRQVISCVVGRVIS